MAAASVATDNVDYAQQALFRSLYEQALVNKYFRNVRFTSQRSQGALMAIEPNTDIGLEQHDSDQLFVVVFGSGIAQVGQVTFQIEQGAIFHVESQKLHNVTNTSDTVMLKLFTVYSGPQHPIGEINITKKDAEHAESLEKLSEGRYRVEPVTSANHIEVIELSVSPEQEPFVGTVAEAIALAHFSPTNKMLALYLDQKVIGFAMYTNTLPAMRITRFLVDSRHQGHGKASFALLTRFLSAQPFVQSIAITVNPRNTAAKHIYELTGFKFDSTQVRHSNGEMEGELIVDQKKKKKQQQPPLKPAAVAMVNNDAF